MFGVVRRAEAPDPDSWHGGRGGDGGVGGSRAGGGPEHDLLLAVPTSQPAQQHVEQHGRLLEKTGRDLEIELLAAVIWDHRNALDWLRSARHQVRDRELQRLATELTATVQRLHDEAVLLREREKLVPPAAQDPASQRRTRRRE